MGGIFEMLLFLHLFSKFEIISKAQVKNRNNETKQNPEHCQGCMELSCLMKIPNSEPMWKSAFAVNCTIHKD